MIVGHGDIASAIVDREDLLFFASGVSNSSETRQSEYQREIDLLLSQDKNQHLVYFGSLCIFYSHSRYALHKKTMEDLVRLHFPKHTIVRMGNIAWGTNPHTLINFFRNQKALGETLNIRDEYRFIILDKAEFQHWLSMIPTWSCEMNITGKRMTIKQIVDELV